MSHTSDATWWRVFAGPGTCRSTRMSLEISRIFRSFGLCRSGKTTKEQFQFRDTLSQSLNPQSLLNPSFIPVLESRSEDRCLCVEGIREGGAVEAWNRQCGVGRGVQCLGFSEETLKSRHMDTYGRSFFGFNLFIL